MAKVVKPDEIKYVKVSKMEPAPKVEFKKTNSSDPLTFDIDNLVKENQVPDHMHEGLRKIFSSVDYSNSMKKDLVEMIILYKSNFSYNAFVDKIDHVKNNTKQYIAWHVMYVEIYGKTLTCVNYAQSCAYLAQAFYWNKNFVSAKKYIDICLSNKPTEEFLALALFYRGQLSEDVGDYELAIQDYTASYKAKIDPNVITQLSKLVKTKNLEVVMLRKMVEAIIDLEKTRAELTKVSAENKDLIEKLYWSPGNQGSKKAESHFIKTMESLDA